MKIIVAALVASVLLLGVVSGATLWLYNQVVDLRAEVAGLAATDRILNVRVQTLSSQVRRNEAKRALDEKVIVKLVKGWNELMDALKDDGPAEKKQSLLSPNQWHYSTVRTAAPGWNHVAAN